MLAAYTCIFMDFYIGLACQSMYLVYITNSKTCCNLAYIKRTSCLLPHMFIVIKWNTHCSVYYYLHLHPLPHFLFCHRRVHNSSCTWWGSTYTRYCFRDPHTQDCHKENAELDDSCYYLILSCPPWTPPSNLLLAAAPFSSSLMHIGSVQFLRERLKTGVDKYLRDSVLQARLLRYVALHMVSGHAFLNCIHLGLPGLFTATLHACKLCSVRLLAGPLSDILTSKLEDWRGWEDVVVHVPSWQHQLML